MITNVRRKKREAKTQQGNKKRKQKLEKKRGKTPSQDTPSMI